MSSLSDQIKSALTAREVLEAYGYRVNRANFAKCPFHDDKTASLKVYDGTRGWHCFGCHAGRDVIDFAMLLFDLPFKDACDRLNTDFSLHLTADKETPVERSERVRAAERAAKELEAYHIEYDRKVIEHRRLWLAKMNKYPKSPDEPFNPEYIEAMHKLPALEHWLNTHPWEVRKNK
jgi:DNA primase